MSGVPSGCPNVICRASVASPPSGLVATTLSVYWPSLGTANASFFEAGSQSYGTSGVSVNFKRR